MTAAQKSKKKPISTEERKRRLAAAKKSREEKKFRSSVKEIFTGSGFDYITSENKEFIFETLEGSRTTELDGIFIYENVVVIVEDTCTNSPGNHLSKKQIIFDLALRNKNQFIDCLKSNIPEFKQSCDKALYDNEHYILKTLYFSMHPVDSEYVESANRIGIRVVERALTNYFYALVKNIASSAKYELLKFLEIPYSSLGSNRLSGGSSGAFSSYKGFLLPEANSSYPDGFKVVSFYVDPASLLKKSFVLRKNSWITPNLSYQRILDMRKIKLMRKYLSDNERVYLGNIIATLPSSTKICDINTLDQLPPDQQGEVKPIEITLPDQYNVVGLIDGQHRVYSYHEGSDSYEDRIGKLRRKQNLLVTGIIYPDNISSHDRILFEATLFLEINSKQTSVKSALIQEIEVIVNPYSSTAIAKSVLTQLSSKGALKDKLEEHVFDTIDKLKVSSIVSYGLKPLTKKDGPNSLFTIWSEEVKKKNILAQKSPEDLQDYLSFCVTEINLILNAARMSFPEGWKVGHESKMLTPTSINGFLKCLRLIIENKDERSLDFYKDKFKNISEFPFENFKSSHWNQLGVEIYEHSFKNNI
ncbi:DGQHR domain-containing protein [Acinetobacter sp. WZC-1]|uniref:DGQHR domain-containing protein n=1 Tax=Acinetobacter sp. WZC-1 TaxID=3459034 RepID=UPI00403DD89A